LKFTENLTYWQNAAQFYLNVCTV